MLALIAAVLFVIAFIINAASVSTDAIFSPFSFMVAGLALLAVHLISAGAWRPDYKRWRR